jgi:hypothetical protein
MNRRRLALLSLLFLLFPASARAETAGPERTGWWFAAQQLPAPAPPLPSPAAVPEGGLYVSYAGDTRPPVPLGANLPFSGTVAYGAVRYVVRGGATGTLTLKTATGSTALSASLQACTTAGSWAAAQAGPWYEQPGYDPTACTHGVVATDGFSVSFDIPPALTFDGELDVAVAPLPGATPFSVIFDRPGNDSFEYSAASAGPGAAGPSAGAVPASAGATGSSTAPAAGGSGGGGVPAAAAEDQAALGTGNGSSAPLVTRRAGQAAEVEGPSGAQKAVVAAMLVGVGALWWWASGMGFLRRPPTADPATYGVGRLARPRDRAARPL